MTGSASSSGAAEKTDCTQAARDFRPGQSLEPQESFVDFKATNCGTGGKDPLI